MKSLSNDLLEFIRLLNRRRVDYVVVGAWAMSLHGRPRYTGDLDLLVRAEPGNADRLMGGLAEFGFGGLNLSREDFLKKDYVVQLGTAPNRVDLLTGISGVSFDEAWAARQTGRIGDIEVPFLSRELLIRNKLATNRPQDRADVEILRKAGSESD